MHLDSTTRLRDTVLLITKISATTLQVAGRQLAFQADGSHISNIRYPQYPLLFVAGYDNIPTIKYMQLDARADSLYVEDRADGHSLGQEWTYYGKKLL